MSESPKPADALRTLPERAFRARARLVAGVFCLVCCGLAVRLLFLQVLGGGWYTDRALVESWKDSILMKRLGDPREVADVIVFLASEKASFITGEVIQINGGQAFI